VAHCTRRIQLIAVFLFSVYLARCCLRKFREYEDPTRVYVAGPLTRAFPKVTHVNRQCIVSAPYPNVTAQLPPPLPFPLPFHPWSARGNFSSASIVSAWLVHHITTSLIIPALLQTSFLADLADCRIRSHPKCWVTSVHPIVKMMDHRRKSVFF